MRAFSGRQANVHKLIWVLTISKTYVRFRWFLVEDGFALHASESIDEPSEDEGANRAAVRQLCRNLAAKHAIDKYKITYRQSHAKAPPDQAERKGVWARSSVIDRDIQRGIGGRNQQVGIDGSRSAHQHEDQVCGGTQKCRFVITVLPMHEHGHQAESNSYRNNE